MAESIDRGEVEPSSGAESTLVEHEFTARGNVTRSKILIEAIKVFDRHGFNGATLRDIAEAADVDLALLAYYFGNKAGLFTAAVESAFDPLREIRDIVDNDRANAGARVADLLISVMEDTSVRGTATGFIRTLLTPAYPVDEMRDSVKVLVQTTLEEIIGGPDRSPRYSLLVAEVFGILVMRWVVPLEPLASAPISQLRDHIAARLQTILDSTPNRRTPGGTS